MPLRASLIPPAKREPSHETLKASRSARSEIRCSPIDVGQATQRVVVVQVYAGAAGGADVGQRTVRRAGEMQEVTENVLDALQRHFAVGAWHFAEVEEQVVPRLQDVVAALGAHQVHLLVRVALTVFALKIFGSASNLAEPVYFNC